MEIVDLLAHFSDPASIKGLSVSQKMLASLVTTLLGMGITFVALVILQMVTSLLGKLAPEKKSSSTALPSDELPADKAAPNMDRNDEELVAAITSTLALLLEKPASSIVVKNITRIDKAAPAWSRAGITDQMNNTV